MSITRFLMGKCKECGKELWFPIDNFRKFNDGKILRCEKCCKKLGIKDYSFLKTYKIKEEK